MTFLDSFDDLPSLSQLLGAPSSGQVPSPDESFGAPSAGSMIPPSGQPLYPSDPFTRGAPPAGVFGPPGQAYGAGPDPDTNQLQVADASAFNPTQYPTSWPKQPYDPFSDSSFNPDAYAPSSPTAEEQLTARLGPSATGSMVNRSSAADYGLSLPEGAPPPLPPPTQVGVAPQPGPPPPAPTGPPPAPPAGAPPLPPGPADRMMAPADRMRDLAAALGIPPYPQQPDARARAISAGLAGLGKGLSALGQLRPGASGAQAFAAGAGGGLTGGHEAQQQQEQQARQAWQDRFGAGKFAYEAKRQEINDRFNQRSTAFKDWIAGEKLGDEHKIADARQRFLDATAAMRAAGGGRGNAMDSWRNSDWYKAQRIESILSPQYRAELASIDKKSKQFGWTEERYDHEVEKLKKDYDARREQMAKSWGIDPNTHKQGTSPADAFDAEKLTEQQLSEMPEGAFFKYRDPKTGKTVVKQRDYDEKPPYQGWQRTPQRQQQPPSAYEVMMEDQMAGAA